MKVAQIRENVLSSETQIIAEPPKYQQIRPKLLERTNVNTSK